jgi:hypothetical protein
VEGLQADDVVRLDSRRKGKLLALEVAARITSADQKCFEIPATEDEGLDIELEFTDDEGKGTGKRVYLQLKAGNSYIRKRKTDQAENLPYQETKVGTVLAQTAASSDACDWDFRKKQGKAVGRRKTGVC